MSAKRQTSIHLLLACIVSLFGMMLILIIMAMSWEMWMIPVILIGNSLVWILHIGRTGSDTFYENLCSGLLLVGFFFFGVHTSTLFDIPAVACMLILVFSMFDKKRLLFMTAALYVLELLYHFFLLHTIRPHMGALDFIRLGLGATVMTGSIAIARYRINRREEVRKRYDQTLAQLETAGRQNAEFLSNVSHELRTPINMVLGISEVLLAKDLPAEIRTGMESIQMAGRRLSGQINNMLNYTEIVEGTLTSAKEPYRITSVLNDIITMAAGQNSRQHLEMVFDLDPKMPSVLVGDVEKISHVLKILLENSIKFTEEGGISVCMEFRRESYGINLVIHIRDTGIGMSDDQLEQMCDDFYQADTGSNRLTGGLGLGLPIARGLLHSMGGFVHFDSGVQEGLQAHITIPQGVVDDTPAMVVSHPEQLCIACYFRPEKFSSDEVRRYYDRMILHMVEGLGLEGYQAHNFEGLLKLQNSHPLTHVFIAQAEYEENCAYYEELARTLRVVVIAEPDYSPRQDSGLLVIRKPFSALSVVNLLNGEAKENDFGNAQAAGRKPFSCEGIRVLAVDDEEMNLVVAKGVLGSYGMQVDTCLSGKEAIERCADISYDMVFLDHMMPGFDGVETLKRIREMDGGKYQELPVIALTANTISGAREMFRHEGFTEFIPKPIERTVLERVLRKVLPEECIQYDGNDSENASSLTLSSENDAPGKSSAKTQPGRTAREEKPVPKLPAPEAKQRASVAGEKPETAAVKNEPEPSVPEEKSKPETPAPEYKPEPEAPALEYEPEAETPVPEEEAAPEAPALEYEPEAFELENDPSLYYAPLIRIGINIQLGLDYCCGENEFYLEMLRMFCSQAVEKRAELVSLYETANWKDYTVKVHALKSTSLTIGAERLADKAKLLEQAGKKGHIEYIRHDHPALLRLYDEVCETIAGL